MSFMDNLAKAAGQLFGGGESPDPQQLAQAASEHIGSLGSGELAEHLQQSLGSLDSGSLSQLGQQLLSAFDNHPASPGDGETAANAAGTTADEVASGSPSAISALVDYAKAHPDLLQSATQAFTQGNPQALTQMAPGFLQGIMARFQQS